MDRPHLSYEALARRSDPMLDSRWACDAIPFNLPANFLESVDIPFNNIGAAENLYGASGYTCYPSTHTIGSVTMTFYEDELATALAWIHKWKAAVKDFGTGVYNLPDTYKREMTVVLMNGRNVDVLKAKLIGLWPAATSSYSLKYSDAGRLVLTQEFMIDDLELTFLGALK